MGEKPFIVKRNPRKEGAPARSRIGPSSRSKSREPRGEGRLQEKRQSFSP